MAITAETRQDIIELVVTAYNSAPGTELLNELVAIVNNGGTLTDVANNLTTRTEWTSKYPAFQTAEEFAAEWLGNLVPEASADALAEGKTVAVGLVNGGSSFGEIIIAAQDFLSKLPETDAAFGTSAANFNNKVEVATNYTITLEQSAQSESAISGVTSDDATVTAANTTNAASAAPTGSTFSLTSGTDFITGTSGDDTINAVRTGSAGTTETYNSNDQINGGAGTDTIYIESDANINMTTQKSLEAIVVNNQGTGAITVTLPTDSAYTNLHSQGSIHDVTFNAIKNASLNGAIVQGTNGRTVTYNYQATALTGSSDSLTVTLDGADGDLDVTGVNNANALETLTLNSISDGELDDIDLTNANTTKLVVTGSGAINIRGITGSATTLDEIDASAATGAVTVTGVNTTANTITGGSGNDTLAGAAGNDTISAGEGADQVSGAAGNDTVTLGAGNDTFVIGTASDVDKNDAVDGGDGTDTITLTGKLDYSATVDDSVGIKNFEVLKSGGAITAQVMTGLNANNSITKAIIGGHTVSMTKDSAIADVTFTADNASLTMETAGTQTLTLAGDNGSGVATDVSASTFKSGATELNIVSAGTDAAADNAVTLTGTALTSITVTGAEDIDATANAAKSLATADFSGMTAEEISFSASASTVAMTFKGGDAQVSALTTGAGADTITLGGKADTVTNSGKGADTITAGAGNDTITDSGAGADHITLGDGDDTVADSGADNDTIIGGAGNDTVTAAGAGDDHLDMGDGNDVVTDAGAGNDTLLGGAGNDNLTAGAGNDSIDGGAGNDTISDGAGNDTVIGGDGVDTITIATGNDSVSGGAGNDKITITGLSSADTIDGGDGTDSLTITNSSTSTLTPQFTSIETVTVNTSTAFSLDLTNATDKTSLKTYYVFGTTGSGGTDDVTLTNLASGSTVNISDDYTWAGATGNPGTGDLDDVSIDTVAGGTLTLNIHADEGALVHAATVLSAGDTTDIDDAATVNITSLNSDSNNIVNDITALELDDDETQTLVLTAQDSAGLDVGDITAAAALQSITGTSAAGAASTIGTMITATSLETLSLTATGTSASWTTGVIGNTTAAKLSSLTIDAQSGATVNLESIDSASSSALTSVSLKASAANSSLNLLTGQSTTVADFGSGTITAFTIDVADNATLTLDSAGADGDITSGAITTFTFNLGNFSTFTDDSSNSNDDLDVNAAVTTAKIHLGRGITNAAGDELNFDSTVTTLNLTTALGSEAITLSSTEVLSYGGATLVDFSGGTLSKATYTHTGSGALNWDGTNLAGTSGVGSTITSNATSTTADTIIGGGANDTLTGNAGNNILTGNGGNDVISGNDGSDVISGGAGNDNLTGGEGIDTVLGGAGNDTITLTESTAAADTAGLTNGGAAITTVGTGSGDDAGADTVTGFDTSTDTLQITATGVTNFVHGTDTGFGQAGSSANAAASTANVTANELKTTAFYFDFDTSGNVYMSTAAVDMVVNMASLKTAGVAYTLTSDTAMEAAISYDLTGTAAADTITTGGKADTIDGGTGADIINTGAGIDTLEVAAGDTVLTIGGAGDSGTIAGFDVVTGYNLGTGSTNAETIDMLSVTDSVLGNGAVDGTNSTLTFGGTAIKSHSVSSGIVTFDDADTYATALTLTTDAHLAAVVEYLQANDLGNAGVTGAFVVGSDTYVYQQGDDAGTDASDILIKLVGVTGTSVSATNANTAGLIDVGA